MPVEILERNMVYLYQLHSPSSCTQFSFAQFADQILQDPVPLNCLLALSEVKSFHKVLLGEGTYGVASFIKEISRHRLEKECFLGQKRNRSCFRSTTTASSELTPRRGCILERGALFNGDAISWYGQKVFSIK